MVIPKLLMVSALAAASLFPGTAANRGLTQFDNGPCITTGCFNQVCAEDEEIFSCEYRPEYACYRTATCSRQPDGECGWTPTAKLVDCLDGGGCVIAGCFDERCSDAVYSSTGTCEWAPEFECYQNATCERQPNADFSCGWTSTFELQQCLRYFRP
jgi:hypothetical protein